MSAIATRERPLLYSGPMVRALLGGEKTQTRRVIKPQPRPGRYGPNHPTKPGGIIGPGQPEQFGDGDYCVWEPPSGSQKGVAIPWTESCWYRIEPECPHGPPGDRLWVRETFSDPFPSDVGCRNFTGFYRATDPDRKVKWKPSIFMPRWASRITLEITEVRVERAHSISDADILAEGIAEYAAGLGLVAGDAARRRELWAHLWDGVNGKRDGGKWAWAVNPWTWVISFRVLEGKETP